MTPDRDGSNLPALAADERAHSEAVLAVVQRSLASAGGWLGFDDYLRIALYEPGSAITAPAA